MQVNTYLNFDGDCEEAFKFYEKCFGGKIEGILHWAGSPVAEQAPREWGEKVLHAGLRIGDGSLLGCDCPPGTYKTPQGFGVPLTVEDKDKAECIFEALAEGGEVQMPLEKTFFAEHFGMVRDRFGIPWMILFQGDADD